MNIFDEKEKKIKEEDYYLLHSKLLNYKGPEFILNKKYPNSDNKTLSEIINSILFPEKVQQKEEKNYLTPKFYTYNNNQKLDQFSIDKNVTSKKENKIIQKDEQSNNKNININININIDITKKKGKSILETLAESKKEKFNRSKFKNSDNVNMKNIKTKASSLSKDIRKEYKFVKQLGGGHFGTVRKAFRINDKEPYRYLAIKSISTKNLSQKEFDDLVKEVEIISGLDHPNIIKFYETFHDKAYFHIVMELCQGKEVFDNLTNNDYMPEKKVVNIIFKVLLAISHCHSRGITHRDLKPENILFESLKINAEIKLIDFGLSRKYAIDEKMHTILGTPYYVAPEVLKGEYDEKCDIWSIGAMTYLMLSGEPPFTGSSNNEIFKKIVKENIRFNQYKWKNISENAKNFVKLCLNKNAMERPSATQAIEHKWFSNVLKEIHNQKNLPKYILMNIKNFNITDKLQQIVMKYLINNMNGDEEINIYKNAFYALDFNHNGCITHSDLVKGYKLANVDITDNEISNLLKKFDLETRDGLDYTEFIMAGIDKKELFNHEKIIKAFNYFDINNSGFIEYEDLYETFLKMGKECIESEGIKYLIHNFIQNSNKMLTNDDTQDKIILKKKINQKDDCDKISKYDFFKIFSFEY